MKKFFGGIADYFRRTDSLLLIICAAASIYGLLLLSIAMQSPGMSSVRVTMFKIGDFMITRQFVVQVAAVILGFLVAIYLSRIDYEAIASLWWIIAPVCIVLVALTFVIGLDTGTGADDRAWLGIPGTPLTFQPSELMKIGFVLTFSLHLTKTRERLNTFKNLALLCIHGIIPVLLISLQGDDGTAIVFFFMFLIMMFTAGVKLRYFAIGFSVLAVVAPIIWLNMHDYQKQRFLIFLHPETDSQVIGFQQYRSRMIIGSGGLWGRGIEESGQIHLPVRHNDFIFSQAGETFGFIGSIVLIGILIFLMMRILRIASFANDQLGSLICTGIFATFLVQSVINIGMNICLMPVIGVTLPFFSAGGSSTSTLFLGIGLVLSVYMQSKPRNKLERIRRL